MSLVDWLYPKKCVGCDRQGKYFCFECLRKIRFSRGFFHDKDFNGLLSLFEYGEVMRRGVGFLKYRFLKDLEKEMYQIFLKGFKRAIKIDEDRVFIRFLKNKPVIVAVPLYWRRENWRGFNQAEIVAKLLAQATDLEIKKDWLIKVKQTRQQVGLSKTERGKNIKGVFKVQSKENIKRVLVVDDVWTTGSTMKEVGRVLKKAGVEQVWGLTLAR